MRATCCRVRCVACWLLSTLAGCTRTGRGPSHKSPVSSSNWARKKRSCISCVLVASQKSSPRLDRRIVNDLGVELFIFINTSGISKIFRHLSDHVIINPYIFYVFILLGLFKFTRLKTSFGTLLMHSSSKLESSSIPVHFFCSFDKVYHKRELCFLLYLLGKIFTRQS